MTWQDTNQQAIEKYLADLLTDDLDASPTEAALAEASPVSPAANQEDEVKEIANSQPEAANSESEASLETNAAAEAELAAAEESPAATSDLPPSFTNPSFNPAAFANEADEEDTENFAEEALPESAQERQLKAAMEEFSAKSSRPHKEPLALGGVLLPNLDLSVKTAAASQEAEKEAEAEPELEIAAPEIAQSEAAEASPAVETLADVLQEIESKQQAEVAPPVEAESLEVVAEEAVEEVAAELPEFTEAAANANNDSQAVAGQPPLLPPSWKNGRPAWAQDRFECLLFNVKGLTLAVPLVELGGIIKIDSDPTPLFGQPNWFLGLLRSNNLNVAMVDTAQWVLPPAIIESNPQAYELIIRIHNSHWGLACNGVDRSISLEPDQVRWRSSLTKRPWLAGTVIEHMCALIDVAAFDRLLKEGHGNLEPVNLASLKESLAND